MSLLTEKVTATDRIVNRRIHEEFTLKNATLYGGYNLYSDLVARSGLDTLLGEIFSAGRRLGPRTICRRFCAS